LQLIKNKAPLINKEIANIYSVLGHMNISLKLYSV